MNIDFQAAPDAGHADPLANAWGFYGLAGDGFRLSPDLRFRYLHHEYAQAIATVGQAVARGEGFVVVTGPPGTGKTTLAQDLLSQQRAAGRSCAEVSSTQVGADDLLRLTACAFGLEMEHRNKASQLAALHQHLAARHDPGRPAILLVDEAQNLDDGALEELRLLNNLTVAGEPLVQVLLFAQDELWRRLGQPEYERLLQHVVGSYQMRPLDALRTRDYIAYRLSRVGWSGQPRISARALQRIHAYTAGIPRRINGFMSHLLQLGMTEGARALDVALVEQVIAQRAEAHLQPPASTLPDPLGLFAPASTPQLQPLDAAAAAAFHEPARRPELRAALPASPGVGIGPSGRGPDAPDSLHRRPAGRIVLAALQRLRDTCSGTVRHLQATATAGGKRLRATTRQVIAGFMAWAANAVRARRGLPAGAAWSRAAGVVGRRWRRPIGWDWSLVPAAATTLIAIGMLAVVINDALRPEEGSAPGLAQSTQGQQGKPERLRPSPTQAPAGPIGPTEGAQARSEPPPGPAGPEGPATGPALVAHMPPPRPLAMSAAERAELFAVPAMTRPDTFVALHGGLEGLTLATSAARVSASPRVTPLSAAAVAQAAEPEAPGDDRFDLVFLDDLPPPAAGPDPEAQPTTAASAAPAVAAPGATADTGSAPAGNPGDADQPSPASALLAKADAAMREHRYTLPPDNNAYRHYKAVLAQDPDNSHARAGLAEISQRYWKLARNKLDADNLDSADRFVKRGLRVDPENRRLLALAREIAQHQNAAAPVLEPLPPQPTVSQLEPPPAEPASAEPPPSGFWARLKAQFKPD